MAIDPISGGLGVLSMIQGKGAQKKAEKQANAANATQQMIIERATKFMDLMMGKVSDAEGQGLFDADKRMANMRGMIDKENQTASSSLAGDLRIAGGHPGEQAVTNRLAGLKANQIQNLSLMKDSLNQDSFFNKLQAYGAANPGNLGSMVSGIAGGQANRAYGMMPNPTGLFQSMMPFLQSGQSRTPTTLERGVAQNMGRHLTAF